MERGLCSVVGLHIAPEDVPGGSGRKFPQEHRSEPYL
jgi:hypothetical protein